MKFRSIKPYVWGILLSVGVGMLSGFLSRGGMEIYEATIQKPPLSPPGIVFPIVWGILYVLMGIGVARIYLAPASPERTRSLVIYGLQLFVNFFWSILFFVLQSFGLSLLWLLFLWALVLWMILSYRRIDSIAAWLQVPYLLWITFAAYLNVGVFLLN